MKRLAVITTLAALFCLCGGADLFAHGGSHPTPWPTPPTPPPPTPGPGRTPTPTGTPSPTPTPTPTPGTGKKSGSTGGIKKASWKEWWEINRWRFQWTSQRQSAASGGTEGQSQDRLIAFLVKQLDHSYYDVRSAAAIALGKAGSKTAVPALTKLVSDSNTTVSESAILALGMLKSTESVPRLLRILSDRKERSRSRVYAAVSLGLAGDRSAARQMMTVATQSAEDYEVRAAALLGLSLLRDESAGRVMVQVLGTASEKEPLRAVAATSLGKLGVHEVKFGRRKASALKYLLQTIQGRRKDHMVRQSAVLAISALGPSADFPQDKLFGELYKLSNDRNTEVQCLTLMGIAELALKGGQVLETARKVFRQKLLHEKNHTVKSFAALAAGLADDRQSAAVLRRMLTSGGNPDVRSAAAVGLGLLKDVGATQLFLDLLGKKTDKTLQGYCCIALGLMGAKNNKEALPKLTDIVSNASDPELRAAAAMALTQLGDTGAVRILIKALTESNAYFKMSAVMAISAFRDLSTVGPLIDLFESDTVNDETKAIIVVALGRIAETNPRPVLRQPGLYYNFLLHRLPTLLQLVNLL
jgi:HEAT repeat protein